MRSLLKNNLPGFNFIFSSIVLLSLFTDTNGNSFVRAEINITVDSNTKSLNKNNISLNPLDDYPPLPVRTREIVSLIVELESSIRNRNVNDTKLPLEAHTQQVLYRFLSKDRDLANNVLELLPSSYKRIVTRHLQARRQFLEMSSSSLRPNFLPAWKIIDPEPASKLLSYYKKAEENTGIAWEILAAINLVETGMGRISGKSIANAQGPMQFLPSTWDENGVGLGGDINSAHDSIQAAARYLVKRGGLENIRKGLWGYNNSDYYGNAVLEYAELLKEDPRAFNGFYHWQIHYNSSQGDVLLPVGYSQINPISISSYLKLFPSRASPDYSVINSN